MYINNKFRLVKENKILINFLIILSFLVLSFIGSSLLLKSNNVYQGFDTQFHFKRIMEISESIKHGQLFPNFSFNEFHGSAVMTFYPYFNLLPAGLLSFMFKSKLILVYGFFIFNTFITFIISFFSSKNYIHSYSTAYIFATIYSLSNIFLVYSLILTDFGIASSFTLLPLIIFGFLKLIRGQKSWIELSLGMILLSYSHILNLFIIGVFLLLFLLINIRKLNKQIILNLIKSIILFSITSSVIWLPFLNLYVHNLGNIHMPTVFQLKNIGLKDFMSGLYGSKSNNSIGFFPIIAIFISLFFYKNFDHYIKQMYWLSLMIIISVLFLPWHLITSYGILKLLNQVQETYRFLIIPQMTLSFIFAVIISQYINSINKRIICYSVIILITLLLQVVMGQHSFINRYSDALSVSDYLNKHDNNIYIGHPPGYKFNDSSQFDKLLNAYQDTNNDYIPKSSVSKASYVNKNLGLYDDKHKIQVKHSGYNNFTFESTNKMNKLSLPLYVYNKERLLVYLNNKQVKYYVNTDGLLTINNIKSQIKDDNNIRIKSNYDVFRLIGIILSILGWLFVLGTVIKNKYNSL